MERKIENISLSKKANRSLVIKILFIWFSMYFPFVNFIQDYFISSTPIESPFYVKLLIFICALVLLVIFIFRFFSNWVIRILPEGLIVRFFYGKYFLYYHDILDVELSPNGNGRQILRLTLKISSDFPIVVKPLKKIFVKTNKDGNPYLLLNLEELDVNPEYLLRLIATNMNTNRTQ